METARALGTERNPSNGRRQNDIDAGDEWAIEHKATLRPMAFIRNAMHQAVEGARKRGTGQTPIVIIASGKGHGVGKGGAGKLERWVVLRFEDFVELTAGGDQEG